MYVTVCALGHMHVVEAHGGQKTASGVILAFSFD